MHREVKDFIKGGMGRGLRRLGSMEEFECFGLGSGRRADADYMFRDAGLRAYVGLRVAQDPVRYLLVTDVRLSNHSEEQDAHYALAKGLIDTDAVFEDPRSPLHRHAGGLGRYRAIMKREQDEDRFSVSLDPATVGQLRRRGDAGLDELAEAVANYLALPLFLLPLTPRNAAVVRTLSAAR